MRDFYSKGRSTVFAENGMCATSHPIAAQAAVDMLKNGGNAMDAAIAGAVLLGICEPQMTGIGGDCFVLFSPAGRDDVLAMNGSGRAPANLTAGMLRASGHDKVPLRDPSAVTIPTAIDAFCTLSEDWGKLGLDRILQPSMRVMASQLRQGSGTIGQTYWRLFTKRQSHFSQITDLRP
jgi:gamma-glutamyltranspeptidase/glutathione hydrolase